MKKKIYIHIGLHKTASTSIQHGLFMNRDELRANGYYIPSSACPFPKFSSHHNLAWDILKDPRYKDEYGSFQALIDEINATECSNIILSSEEFSFFDQTQKKELRNRFKGFDVAIILYLREQCSWFYSMWTQSIKSLRNNQRFEAWIDSASKRIWKRLHATDFLDLVKNWKQVFRNVSVRVLEKGQIQDNVIYDLLKTAKVENLEDYQVPNKLNVSPSRTTLAYMHHIGALLKTEEIEDGALLRRISRVILEYGNQHFRSENKGLVLPPELCERLQANFRDTNNQLAKKHLSQDQLFYIYPVAEDQPQDVIIDPLHLSAIYELIIPLILKT